MYSVAGWSINVETIEVLIFLFQGLSLLKNMILKVVGFHSFANETKTHFEFLLWQL